MKCDVPDCQDDVAVKCGDEQRCYAHALQRGNEIRAGRGLPPITFDDDGSAYVVQ